MVARKGEDMSRFTKKAGGESSEGNLIFVKPAGFTGIIAEGQLVGTLPNRFDESRDDFKILADAKIELEGVDSKGAKYVLEVAEGDTLVVNGAGNLNHLMKSVGTGNLCQISYFGKKEISKGDKKGMLAHTFEVMYE